MQKIALITAGLVFALLATSHAIRWLYPVEVLINGKVLPFVVSLSSGIILALMSAWMFFVVKKMKTTPKENKKKEETD